MSYSTNDFPDLTEAAKRDVYRAIDILKDLNATEVYVFGSALSGSRGEQSDIDIAVRGMKPKDFFSAIAKLQGIMEHRCDLVNLDFESEFTQSVQHSGKLYRVA